VLKVFQHAPQPSAKDSGHSQGAQNQRWAEVGLHSHSGQRMRLKSTGWWIRDSGLGFDFASLARS
jgi:hypothetical protein